jgi:hypothetical protein
LRGGDAVSRPARWECEDCRRLLGEIEDGRLRIARSVEVVYAADGGVAVVCPGCEEPRVWRWGVTVAS